MGQVGHGSATTTYAVRAEIQRSQASLWQPIRELGINPKTVAKWLKRATLEDIKTRPKEPRSTTLIEAMIVAPYDNLGGRRESIMRFHKQSLELGQHHSSFWVLFGHHVGVSPYFQAYIRRRAVRHLVDRRAIRTPLPV